VLRESGATPTQTKVGIQLAMGKTKPVIADELGIQRSTVEGLTKKLYQTLDVHNSAELGTKISLPQPRQEIAAIPDQRRETPSFIDRLRSEASVTIFPVALPLRRSTASRAAMHSATGLTGDRWRLAWPPAPRPR
jgi:DNA-binding CsgD family transcriptional regulator